MALAVSRPDLTRAQILKAAARQFVEGDVQHWWHEPAGRGVRTRFSDDLLWLPYAASHYLDVTGDRAILDETVPFLEGAVLAPGQLMSYFEPRMSAERGTLFEHCARALDRSLAVGVHGLPLMGTGDWNDGMNRVGVQGKGESVWLAWFLHASSRNGLPVAAARGETRAPRRGPATPRRSSEAVEREAWDGNWYRRAYFDDGTPLGNAGSDACAIDFDRAIVECYLGRCRSRPRATGNGVGRRTPGAAERRRDPSADAAVRSYRARAWIHQGVRARGARKWGAVHARRRMVGHRVRRAR